MQRTLFYSSACVLLAGCVAAGHAQTNPAGQLSRQASRHSQASTTLDVVPTTNGVVLPAKKADSHMTLAERVAAYRLAKANAAKAIADRVRDLQIEMLDDTKADKAKTPKPMADPSQALSLQAEKNRAAAAAKEADTAATNAKAAVAEATKAAGSPDDFTKIAGLTVYADEAVASASVADDYAVLAANTTILVDATAYADKAIDAAEVSHLALTSYVDGYPVITKECVISGFDAQGNPGYKFRTFLPLLDKNCNDAAVLAYYGVSRTTTIANQAQYLYNAAQSTNQVSADLLTTTFSGGVQVVLAGTATAGSSQAAGSGTSAAATTTTDSVSTAVSKLEQGGDFNLRAAYPLANYASAKGGYYLSFFPNLGFTVNGLSSQSTITESTEYSGNIPVEFYGEYGSIPNSGTAAVLYVDAKVGGDFVSQALATKLGTSKAFFLGQFSAGIEFAKSVRIGVQYFLGPAQAYCVPNTTGCTAVTGTMSGAHLVVSFTPPSGK